MFSSKEQLKNSLIAINLRNRNNHPPNTPNKTQLKLKSQQKKKSS